MSVLLGVGVFKDLPKAALDAIEAAGTVLTPRDGTRLFMEGDAGDSVYAVTGGDGRVRVGSIAKSSKSFMIQVFHAGDIFGEISVIDGGARTAQAVIEGRVQLLRIPGGVFKAALMSHPALGVSICRMMAERIRRTHELLEDATFEPLEVRFARQVLYLAKGEGRRTEQGVRLGRRFRQAELADLLGTTTRSVITILNAWRSAGIVAYDAERGFLTVSREEELRALIEGDADNEV